MKNQKPQSLAQAQILQSKPNKHTVRNNGIETVLARVIVGEMLKVVVATLVAVWTCSGGAAGVDCNNEPQHTLCLRREACGGKRLLKTSSLDEVERAAVLDVHNRLRQHVALGQVRGQPQAKNMRQLVWNNDLADVAQRWAEQCKFDHDKHYNRKIDAFRYVGQNLAYEWQAPHHKDQLAPVVSTTVAMFNEHLKPGFPASNISPFESKGGTGHYTQIAWAETEQMGCGFVMYEETKTIGGEVWHGQTKLIVCDFGPGGNLIGGTMYEVGAPSCPVFSSHYPGLCSTPEVAKSFEAPCDELKGFKDTFPLLCDDRAFLNNSGVVGVPDPGDGGGRTWVVVVVVGVLVFCLLGAAVVVHRLGQLGRLPPMNLPSRINVPKWQC